LVFVFGAALFVPVFQAGAPQAAIEIATVQRTIIKLMRFITGLLFLIQT
jgi:hypothetical protein